MYQYCENSLRVIIVAFPFRKMTVLDFPIKPLIYLAKVKKKN